MLPFDIESKLAASLVARLVDELRRDCGTAFLVTDMHCRLQTNKYCRLQTNNNSPLALRPPGWSTSESSFPLGWETFKSKSIYPLRLAVHCERPDVSPHRDLSSDILNWVAYVKNMAGMVRHAVAVQSVHSMEICTRQCKWTDPPPDLPDANKFFEVVFRAFRTPELREIKWPLDRPVGTVFDPSEEGEEEEESQ